MAQTGKVLSFLRVRPSSADWTQQELAEFYRVENALLQHGLLVTTDRGLSDDGDPWFVFCRSDTEEVIAHFARVDGHYLVVSSAFSGVARGRDFKLLVRQLMDAHPFMLPRNDGSGQKIFVHPAAVLAALLAASYIISSDKDAAVQDVSAPGHETAFWLNFRHEFAILSAVAAAAIWIEHHVESAFDLGQDITILHDAGQDANSPIHVTSHAFDAASFDSVAQALQGDDTPSRAVTGDPTEVVALEQNTNPREVTFSPPSPMPQGPSQSTAASAPEANLIPGSNGDDVAASHPDTAKASSSLVLNDVDELAQALVDPNSLGEARLPHGSSAPEPTSSQLSSAPITPTDAVPSPSLPVVVSTASASSSDIQNISTLSTSPVAASTTASAQTSTDTSSQTPTNALAQVSTDASAQGVASATTQQSSAGTLPTPAMAQLSAAVLQNLINVKLIEAQASVEHTILGIISHLDASHHS